MTYTKIILSAAVLAIASAAPQSYQSNKYPAGLNPHLCPHYPYCDNAALGSFAQGVQSFSHGGLAAPGYPAALSPHACPNYPYCSHQIPHEAIHYRRSAPHAYAAASVQAPVAFPAALSHGPQPAKYPAGVHPASCPNYPYCH